MNQSISKCVAIRQKTPRAGYVLADMDGCISNDLHRTYITDIDNYHKMSPTDAPYRGNLKFINGMCDCGGILKLGLIITTARPWKYRGITEQWLSKHNVDYDWLMMRPDGCTLSSPELKNGMAHLFCMMAEPFYGIKPTVRMIFDDKKRVVDYLLEHNWHASLMDNNTDASYMKQGV